MEEEKFTISVELVPPRNGTSPQEMYDNLEKLKNKVDFVSVTKGAGGSFPAGTDMGKSARRRDTLKWETTVASTSLETY